MHIGNIEVYHESVKFASACSKVLRKRLLEPDNIGLIPTGWFSFNNNYIKKALMWLLHMLQTDVVEIMHVRNGRDYRLPELPHFNVDSYCPDTRTICRLFVRHYHGHTCQPFRDITNMIGGQLAERYTRTISRLKQITRAGYLVNVQWECEIHDVAAAYAIDGRGGDNARSQRSRVQTTRIAPHQCRRLLPRNPYNLRVLWSSFLWPDVPAVP